MQNRRSQLEQHPDFHITSSTILASTLHITRLNTRNQPPLNTNLNPGDEEPLRANGAEGTRFHEQRENVSPNVMGNPMQIPGQPDLRQAETGPNPGPMNSFSSLLLWILGGASSEGLNSFLSIFRDLRDQGQDYTDDPGHESHATQNVQ